MVRYPSADGLPSNYFGNLTLGREEKEVRQPNLPYTMYIDFIHSNLVMSPPFAITKVQASENYTTKTKFIYSIQQAGEMDKGQSI